MIPLIQSDYYKYYSMFRGNHVKGVTYLKSLLNNPETREQITTSVPALSAIFTDFSKNAATRLCFDLLKDKPYFETSVLNYLRGMEETEYETAGELFNDLENTFKLLRNPEYDPIINQSCLLDNLLKRQKTLKALVKPENIDILLTKEKLDGVNNCVSSTSKSISSSFTTYCNTLVGNKTEFAELETYYETSSNQNWSVIDDESESLYMPARVRTRYNSGSTYYYYPAVFKYDIKNAEWNLIYVGDTETKSTSTSYNSRITNALAYDKKNKNLYIFYKALYNNASIYCDILNIETNTLIVTKKLLGNEGSSEYQAPFYCIFDEEAGAAKYVWSTNSINLTYSATYGWLQGVTLNANEIIWSGKACHPTAECSSIYASNTAEIDIGNRKKMMNNYGAVVGTFQTAKSTSESKAGIIMIKSEGNEIKGKYITIPGYSSYSTLKTPAECTILPDGLVCMIWNSIYWAGNNYKNAAIMFNLSETNPTLRYNEYDSSSTLSIYPSFYFNKILINETSGTTARYRVCGLNKNKTIQTYLYTTGITNAFNLPELEYRGSNRYYTSACWTIYDIEGGLRKWN